MIWKKSLTLFTRMDFFQGMGGAEASLLWSSASQVKEVIPAGFFKIPDGSAPGLKLEWFNDTELENRQAETVVLQVAFSGSLEKLFPTREAKDEIVVDLTLPPGSSQCQWLDTISGNIVKTENVHHANVLTLVLPTFDRDIALAIRK